MILLATMRWIAIAGLALAVAGCAGPKEFQRSRQFSGIDRNGDIALRVALLAREDDSDFGGCISSASRFNERRFSSARRSSRF